MGCEAQKESWSVYFWRLASGRAEDLYLSLSQVERPRYIQLREKGGIYMYKNSVSFCSLYLASLPLVTECSTAITHVCCCGAFRRLNLAPDACTTRRPLNGTTQRCSFFVRLVIARLGLICMDEKKTHTTKQTVDRSIFLISVRRQWRAASESRIIKRRENVEGQHV